MLETWVRNNTVPIIKFYVYGNHINEWILQNFPSKVSVGFVLVRFMVLEGSHIDFICIYN